MSPNVSVLLPVFNGEPFVRQAVESVLAQTYGDFEFIIVDNASTDNTGSILREYTESDDRIRLFRNESTLPRLENFALTASYAAPESRWLKYIGADDRFLPDCLAEMVRVGEQSPTIGLVSSQCYDGDRLLTGTVPADREMVPGPAFLRRLLLERDSRETVFSPASLMISHRVFQEAGGFRVSLIHSDTELFYLILNRYDLGFVHRPLTCTGQRPGSGMSVSLAEGIAFSEGYTLYYRNLKRYDNVRLNFWEVERIKYELVNDSAGFMLAKLMEGRLKAAFSHLRQIPAAAAYYLPVSAAYFTLLAFKKLICREPVRLLSRGEE